MTDRVHFHDGSDSHGHLNSLSLPVGRKLGRCSGARSPRPVEDLANPATNERLAERQLQQQGWTSLLDERTHYPANHASAQRSAGTTHLEEGSLELLLELWIDRRLAARTAHRWLESVELLLELGQQVVAVVEPTTDGGV